MMLSYFFNLSKRLKTRCKKPITLLVSFILALTNFLSAQSTATLKAGIEKALTEEGLTGAVWSVVDENGNIQVDAAGIRNRQTGALLTPANKVHIGSITKTLIATGILRLATQKRIAIDDPVNKYIPDLQFENPWNKTVPVTIRHLMDHTSGLTDIRLWQIFSKKAQPNTPLAYAFKKDPEVLRIYSKPGSIFSYSNMGYTLLAMIIESVTKERYEDYLDRHLLKPLGMVNSTFKFVAQTGSNADAGLAYGHLDQQVIYAALPMYLRPAGQFTTTAYDMALFARFLMSNGTLADTLFIDATYLSQMGRPAGTIANQQGLKVGYGLGAMTRDRHGNTGLAHSGNIVGYHAMLYWFPEHHKAFFISHNMDSETANYERFNEILIRHLKLDKPTPDPKGMPATGLDDWNGYYIPVFSKVAPFTYLDHLSGFSKITMHDDFVEMAPFQKTRKKLKRVTEGNLLIAEGRTETSHIFYKDASGLAYISDGFSSLKKISGYYLAAQWISFLLGCSGLICLAFAGLLQTIRLKRKIFYDNAFGAFLAVLFLLIPIPFLIFQPFSSIGDLSAASVLLFISTCLFPLGLIYTFVLYLKRGLRGLKNKLIFAAVLFSLQWVFVLTIWGLVPFRLWI